MLNNERDSSFVTQLICCNIELKRIYIDVTGVLKLELKDAVLKAIISCNGNFNIVVGVASETLGRIFLNKLDFHFKTVAP